MEPAVNSAVPTVRLGQTTQCRGGWRVWVRNTLVLVVFLGFTGWFAAAAYGARHRPRELTYALLIYFLLVQLVFLVARFEQVRPDDPAGNRRQIRVAVWVVSLTLANTTASCVVDFMPVAALRMIMWALSTVVTGIAFYYLFCNNDDAGCCNVEHGRGQAALLPEQKV